MEENYRSPRKLNTVKAFKFYCTPTSDGYVKEYKDVASEFGVSLRTVQTWGARQNWVRKRHLLNRKKMEAYAYSFKYKKSEYFNFV